MELKIDVTIFAFVVGLCYFSLMLKTRNIYIDTQAFVANNYFQSENLRRLAAFGRSGKVRLYMTEITRQEIMDNAAGEIMEAVREINEFRKKLANKGKILKNIDAYKTYLDLPKAQVPEHLDKLASDLQSFLSESGTIMLPHHTADLKDIVERYFKKAKPFGAGKKKHEFPDAIVVSCIEHWCAAQKEKMYLISGDTDMLELTSAHIIPMPTLKDMLDLINRHTRKRTEFIYGIFQKHEVLIEDRVAEAFCEKLEGELGELELHDAEVSTVRIYDYFVVQDNPGSGEVVLQFDYDIDFSASISYDDYSTSFFNIESGRHFGTDRKTTSVSLGTTQTAEVTIEVSKGLPDEEPSVYCSYTSIPDAQRILDRIDDRY